MSAKELIRYMLVPAIVVGVIVQNIGKNLPVFSLGETISIFMGIALAAGYVAYLHEVERASALAEARAKAEAEYERLSKQFAANIAALEETPVWDEAAQYYWERNFQKIQEWREQIGQEKEEDRWE